MTEAKSLMESGQPEQAWRLLADNAGESSPDALYLRAVAALQCGQPGDAVKALTACLKLAPSHPGAIFHLATRSLALGDRTGALQGFTRAVQFAPGWAEAHYNLATLQAEMDDAVSAEASYRQALRLKPGLAQAANNLANLLDARGERDEAIALLQSALTANPTLAQAWGTLGYLLLASNRLDAAEHALARAVSLDSGMADAWANLAESRRQRKDAEGAREAYEALLRVDPSAEVARFHLATLNGQTPSQPPDEYVRHIFDGMAEEFDHRLVDVLGYRLPYELARHLDGVLHAPASLDVLDLGCGTGLSGEAIKPWAKRLHGVDLSPRMLARAQARQVYDALYEGEIIAFCAQCQDSDWDLLLATDVLVYLGSLEGLFGQARRLLRHGGRLLLSIEELDTDEDYVLQPTGRYAHRSSYLERLAADHGFIMERNERIPLRSEGGSMLQGRLLRFVALPVAG